MHVPYARGLLYTLQRELRAPLRGAVRGSEAPAHEGLLGGCGAAQEGLSGYLAPKQLGLLHALLRGRGTPL